MTRFDEKIYWKILQPNMEPVHQPENPSFKSYNEPRKEEHILALNLFQQSIFFLES